MTTDEPPKVHKGRAVRHGPEVVEQVVDLYMNSDMTTTGIAETVGIFPAHVWEIEQLYIPQEDRRNPYGRQKSLTTYEQRKASALFEQGWSVPQVSRITGLSTYQLKAMRRRTRGYKKHGFRRSKELYTPWVDPAWHPNNQIGQWCYDVDTHGNEEIRYYTNKHLKKREKQLAIRKQQEAGFGEDLAGILEFLEDEYYDCVCGLTECICDDD